MYNYARDSLYIYDYTSNDYIYYVRSRVGGGPGPRDVGVQQREVRAVGLAVDGGDVPLDVALAPRECSFPSPFPLNPVYCLYRIAKEVQGGGRGGHASGSVGR